MGVEFFGNVRCEKCLTVHAVTDKCYVQPTLEELRTVGTIEPTFNSELGLLLEEVQMLVLSKQHDYGHKNIQAHGLEGLCVRIADKQARLHNLVCVMHGGMLRKDGPIHESVRDTFMDLVGYGLLGLMCVDGTFELSLADDVRLS